MIYNVTYLTKATKRKYGKEFKVKNATEMALILKKNFKDKQIIAIKKIK